MLGHAKASPLNTILDDGPKSAGYHVFLNATTSLFLVNRILFIVVKETGN